MRTFIVTVDLIRLSPILQGTSFDAACVKQKSLVQQARGPVEKQRLTAKEEKKGQPAKEVVSGRDAL